MNKFQHALNDYFKDCAEYFVESLFGAQTEKFVLIDNVFPHIFKFLEHSLRRDISLYEAGSKGYHQVQNMLIELQITKQDSEMASALCSVVSSLHTN